MPQQPHDEIVLYHYWRSSCSWRVRWALNIKSLPYKSIAVNLLKSEQTEPSYLKINPSGTVPALRYNGLCLTESLAILEWLEERFPTPPLLPLQPEKRWQVRQIANHIATGIQPIQNLKVLRHVAKLGLDQQEWARHWIFQGLASLESLLQPCASSFAIGAQLTFADLCLVPQCYNAKRFGVPLDKFPNIHRIYQNCMAMPSCVAASPENQPGAAT